MPLSRMLKGRKAQYSPYWDSKTLINVQHEDIAITQLILPQEK
jgi:hypothetical protein